MGGRGRKDRGKTRKENRRMEKVSREEGWEQQARRREEGSRYGEEPPRASKSDRVTGEVIGSAFCVLH